MNEQELTKENGSIQEADVQAAEEETMAQADDHTNGRDNSASAAGETNETQVDEVQADEVTLEDPQEIITRLEAELAEVSNKADQYLDQMQRTAAEFQNVRRRQERQLEQSIERATEGMLRRLLPVLDDFELALSNVPASLEGEEKAWTEGFERIHQKLVSLVEEEGVQPIERSGEFDPNRHEAVTHEPSDDVESGHIIETLRTGYEYKDRVLRPALVRVAQ